MKLLERFQEKMESLGIQADSRLLVAVSGGADSMVLLHLTVNGGYNTSVAHANFKLRDTESDEDENFVKQACIDINVPLYTEILRVDKKHENVQIAARKVRYDWFEKLCESHGFEYILTAHHLNDRIETFFIHLLRGSGVKGLRSIPEKNENILRPILDFSKEEILAYAKTINIAWREDATNKETDYLRNKIRHGLAVDFSKLSESADANLAKSMDFLTEANQYFQRTAKAFIGLLKVDRGVYYIPENQWDNLFHQKPLHKYVFDVFGFLPDQLDALSQFGESQSGKQMQSDSYVVYRDRNQFVIEPIQKGFPVEIPIHLPEGEIKLPIHVKWKTIQNATRLPKLNPKSAILNFDKLKFPLVMRSWKPGDKFIPLGMKGSKKISDFLTDQKLSVPEKNKILVLETDGKICWIAGMRIDESYKYERGDKTLFVVEWLEK